MSAPVDNGELALARQSIQAPGADTRPISRVVPGIVEQADPVAACELVCTPAGDIDRWLPEALALFNTPGLSLDQKRRMIGKIFPGAESLSDKQVNSLASSGARIGRYGFSFPQWRYLTQTFEGSSLVERYGMRRLKRSTDVRDPNLPDPARDRLGAGFVWNEGPWYVEYRRAYIICSNRSASNSATLVIRNNSYFYGRDRLPDPVYVSWEPLSNADLEGLTEDTLTKSGRFARWQDVFKPGQKVSAADRVWRTEKLVDFLDMFDGRLSAWLCIPRGGLTHLISFLRSRLPGGQASGKPGLPFVAGINSRMPPWFPKFSLPLTPELVDQLETFRTGRTPESPELKGLLDSVMHARTKMVLLSGKNGDLPVNASPPRPAVSGPIGKPADLGRS